MNREQEIDQLLASWLDEGPEVTPERYVWAALERIETTRQRGALWAPLEEFFMRLQPIAAVAGVAAMLIAGIGLYLVLFGGSGIGDPDATESPAGSVYETDEFAIPLRLAVPEGWVTYEAREGVVTGTVPEEGTVSERLIIFRTTTAEIFSGTTDGWVPWPDDLAAWLADNPVATEAEGPGSIEVDVLEAAERMVAGSDATVVEAISSVNSRPDEPQAFDLIAVSTEGEGLDVVIRPGEMTWRFVTVPDRDLAMAYGALPDEFSEARFESVVDSIEIRGE